MSAALAGLIMALSPAHAHELGRWCDVASEVVVDCPCATEFLSQNLSPDDADLIMQLWASGSSNPRRPSQIALAEQHGNALLRATLAFNSKRYSFLLACPRTKLSLIEDVDDAEHDMTGSIRSR